MGNWNKHRRKPLPIKRLDEENTGNPTLADQWHHWTKDEGRISKQSLEIAFKKVTLRKGPTISLLVLNMFGVYSIKDIPMSRHAEFLEVCRKQLDPTLTLREKEWIVRGGHKK